MRHRGGGSGPLSGPLPPPLFGGRSLHRDPWREGHRALPRLGRINRPVRFPHRRRDLRSLLRGESVQEAFRGVLLCQGVRKSSLPGKARGFRGGRTPSNASPSLLAPSRPPSWEREKGAAGVMGGQGRVPPGRGFEGAGAPRQPQCITLGRLAPRHYAVRRRPRCPRLARPSSAASACGPRLGPAR